MAHSGIRPVGRPVERWEHPSGTKTCPDSQNMRMRKKHRRKRLLPAREELQSSRTPIGARARLWVQDSRQKGWRLHKGICMVPPLLKRWIWVWQPRTPRLAVVGCIFPSSDRPRVITGAHEKSIQPSFFPGVTEVVVRDPSHEALPIPPVQVSFQEFGTTLPKFFQNGFGQFRSPFQRWPRPIRQCFPVYKARGRLSEANRINPLNTCHALAQFRDEMCGRVASLGHQLPFFEARISERPGLLPVLDALRPTDFGSLIARLSDGVIRNGVKPAFLPGKAENAVVNPVFHPERQRPVLGRFHRQPFFVFEKCWTSLV